MTPAERAVIAAAMAYAHKGDTSVDYHNALIAEVDALEAERAAAKPEVSERTWAEVVEGDEIFSARTDKWYEVTEAREQPAGRRAVHVKGLPKILKPKGADSVRVRRGPTGDAVDIVNSIMISGSNGMGAL